MGESVTKPLQEMLANDEVVRMTIKTNLHATKRKDEAASNNKHLESSKVNSRTLILAELAERITLSELASTGRL